MRPKVKVSVSFKEEIIGDNKDSDSFYVKMTPVVKMTPIITPEYLQQEAIRALQKEVNKLKKGKR